MDVGGWLRSLGLGQYEANFRDNKIDADVLADLTDGDLEKLGLPLGDRKRLLLESMHQIERCHGCALSDIGNEAACRNDAYAQHQTGNGQDTAEDLPLAR